MRWQHSAIVGTVLGQAQTSLTAKKSAEPEVTRTDLRSSHDKKLVIFTSNMFGPSNVFGTEVDKAVDSPDADVRSTPDLAQQFKPVDPKPTH
jgi:hypothetical protein